MCHVIQVGHFQNFTNPEGSFDMSNHQSRCVVMFLKCLNSLLPVCTICVLVTVSCRYKRNRCTFFGNIMHCY